jgi:hypothetical protein
MMGNVLLVTKQMYIEKILGQHYTDKWIGFIWLLIGKSNGSFSKRQCGEISWSAEQLLLVVKARDQRCQLAKHRLSLSA